MTWLSWEDNEGLGLEKGARKASLKKWCVNKQLKGLSWAKKGKRAPRWSGRHEQRSWGRIGGKASVAGAQSKERGGSTRDWRARQGLGAMLDLWVLGLCKLGSLQREWQIQLSIKNIHSGRAEQIEEVMFVYV